MTLMLGLNWFRYLCLLGYQGPFCVLYWVVMDVKFNGKIMMSTCSGVSGLELMYWV